MLIAIDGVDSSGKQTQSKLLYERLKSEGYNVRLVSFPDYDNQSSMFVKMYLSGEFGNNADDVNAYAASTFFALDRFVSYKKDWGDSDEIIIADRYVSSNMIHQASKIEDKAEKEKFLKWLYDLEYNVYGIPKPDITIFLDMPLPFIKRLMKDRPNKIDGSDKKDIHENDNNHLEKSYNNAVSIAEKYNWDTIKCADEEIKSQEEIAEEIYNIIKKGIA